MTIDEVEDRPYRVAILADTDSRWKWGVHTAQQLSPARLDPYQLDGPAAANARQLAEVDVDVARVHTVDLGGFLDALRKTSPDVVVIALAGGGCQAVLHAMSAGWPSGPRPLVVTGYVGVVYEKLVEGLLLRAGADVVVANSPEDAARFRQVFAAMGVDPATVVESRLPFLGRARPEAPGTPFTVTFAAQPGVPHSRADRSYIVRRLAAHARLFPDREVLIKLRALPGERMTHPEQYAYDELLRIVEPQPPANLRAESGPMSEVLDRTDLLVTVSSTAAVEAMHRRIPTVLLTDFGVRESLGNPYFVGSGCLASFDAVDDGHRPVADLTWSAAHGVTGVEDSALLDRVRHLMLSGAPAPLMPYYTGQVSPVYLPRLLASYGVDPMGVPTGTAERDGEVRRFMRRAIRGTARTMYHHGVSRVAPALRRLGAL